MFCIFSTFIKKDVKNIEIYLCFQYILYMCICLELFRPFCKNPRYRWRSRWDRGNWCQTRTASSTTCRSCRSLQGPFPARSRSTLSWCRSSVSENKNLTITTRKKRNGERSTHASFDLWPHRSLFSTEGRQLSRSRKRDRCHTKRLRARNKSSINNEQDRVSLARLVFESKKNEGESIRRIS